MGLGSSVIRGKAVRPTTTQYAKNPSLDLPVCLLPPSHNSAGYAAYSPHRKDGWTQENSDKEECYMKGFHQMA